jgi:peptide deformylase
VKAKRLPLYYYGHPMLRKHCEPVKEITDGIRQLVADMILTMDENNGAGLAAPQVGFPVRLFVLRYYIEGPDGHYRLSAPQVYINPKLSNPSQQTIVDSEGCLSFPHLRIDVERPLKITVEATDLNGEAFVEELEGYNARIRMHENDHINGVLHIDRIDAHARNKIEPFLREIKKKFKSPDS